MGADGGEVAGGEANGPAARRRSLLRLLFKIAVSAALMLLLVKQMPGDRFWAAVKRADPWLLLVALAIVLLRAGLWGERFRFLLSTLGIAVSWGKSVRSYFVGFFASLGLPTIVGGDVARGIWLHREVKRGADMASVVLFERAVGLAVVATIVLPLLWTSGLLSERPGARGALSVFAALILFVFLGLLSLRIRGLIRRAAVAILPERVGKAAGAVLSRFGSMGRSARTVAVTAGWSAAGQVTTILAGIVLAHALEIGAPTLLLAAVFPVVWLATMLPVSFGGLGLRETTLYVLLSPHGVPEERCVLLGMALSALFLAQGAVGGALFLTSRRAARIDRD